MEVHSACVLDDLLQLDQVFIPVFLAALSGYLGAEAISGVLHLCDDTVDWLFLLHLAPSW